MHFHPLHSTDSHHSTGSTAIALLGVGLHAFAVSIGVAVRFLALSLLACLFISAPISFREVLHASHHSSPGQ